MPEKIKPRDDERLREAGFLPEGDRHLGEMISGPLLWHHVDERSRTFTTAEALERLAEREGDGDG